MIPFFKKYTNSKNNKNTQNIIVVITMSYFGDALVGNSLIQNIKRLYPNSKLIYIINKKYYEVAKHQQGVDDVIFFDKDDIHKGFFGLIKFLFDFPYKNIKYVFKMSKKARVDILSFLLFPNKIINYNADSTIPANARYNNLLKEVTNEKIIQYPIKFNATKKIPKHLQKTLSENENYIALCTVSSSTIKDMPITKAINVVNIFNNHNFKVLLLGEGEKSKEYSIKLREKCEFINLVNKTTIYELAQVLRNCKLLISVDTGTMHLGYANNVPTVCVFYNKDTIKGWAPDKKLYPHTEVLTNDEAKIIYNSYLNLCNLNK